MERSDVPVLACVQFHALYYFHVVHGTTPSTETGGTELIAREFGVGFMGHDNGVREPDGIHGQQFGLGIDNGRSDECRRCRGRSTENARASR